MVVLFGIKVVILAKPSERETWLKTLFST